ncbi:hypothetical protein [Brachybacterium nesterenkovii]|uniref:hypothetical protein n=1 Tax=Brachybacterium nesterenkovii TaxID=47847 RepID=UPI000B35EB38|nr:hypothetical protein [Brachybacterium nesterenkovii]
MLIAHSLVTEALARGWTVTPVVGVAERREWEPRYTRYDSPALLFLDAGHAQVGIIFNEVTKRVPHEDTKDEAARRARGDYVWAPTYDHIGDGRLRLHLTDASGRKLSKSWADGVRMQVEDRISNVLGAVEQASHDAVAREEARIRREEEERLRRFEAQRIDALCREYEEWEAALHTGTSAWLQHRELSAFVDSVEVTGGDESRAFVEWARAHLAAVDPRRQVPTGDTPAWPHEEHARRGRYDPKPRYGW